MSGIFAEVDGRKVHYHRFGSGEPLLLLHGSGPGVTGLENFSGNIDCFSKHFETFVLDLPGYGESDPAPGVPDVAAMESVIGFMDVMGIASAHIIGNSFGAIVGGRMAAAHPDRVSSLVMIGGLGFGIFGPFPNEGINLLSAFATDPTRERLEQWLLSMVYDPSLVTEELIERRFAQATEPKTLATTRVMYSKESLAALKNFIDGPAGLESIAFASRITCPALMCWGRDDRVTMLDRALLSMRLIPNCELHVFPKCGHWAMIERKIEFEATVLAFLLRGSQTR